jgi:hypothetical protein
MSLQLTLPPQLEGRLHQEAQRRGQPAEVIALQLLDEYLPPPLDEHRTAAIAMLEQWMKEDAQSEVSEQEAAEFFQQLDADRLSNRPLFPPDLKGISW